MATHGHWDGISGGWQDTPGVYDFPCGPQYLDTMSPSTSLCNLRAGDFQLNALRGTRRQEQGSFPLGPLMWRGSGWESLLWQVDKRLLDVINLETQVMQSGTVLFEPAVQRMPRLQRFDQLQVGISQVEMGQPDRPVVDHLAVKNLQPHTVTPDLQRLLGVGDQQGDMIETTEYGVIHKNPAAQGDRA